MDQDIRTDLAAAYGEERLPRYTSYPTAPHFSPAIGAASYGDWLADIPADATASLYLHVPFCREMCWYCGCHTQIVRRHDLIASYQRALRREIELAAERIGRPLATGHVHFGGGTPTILPPAALAELITVIRRMFSVTPAAEFAIEIDPRTLTPAMIRSLAQAGVNRASLGVQSFDPRVQRAINRVQSFDETSAATLGLRRAGIAGINFDLIYGLPHQTVDSCVETVKRSLQLRPDRVSVFGYAHVPGFKKHQRMIEEAALPAGPSRHEQACAMADALREAGYVQIGLDHFALPGDAMAVASGRRTLRRNFQGYTTDIGDVLLGFGASAIGRLPQGYVQNAVAIGAYMQALDAGLFATTRGYRLNADDRLRAEIIERIMCEFEADLGAICRGHDAAPAAVLRSASRLPRLVADGVVRLEGERLIMARGSRFLVRSVAAAFDAHLDVAKPLHSRAV